MSQLPWPLISSSSDLGASKSAVPRANNEPQPVQDAIPIIALCHLSWSWVWQRPQQFLSRFSREHRVLFVETYCSDVAATSLETHTPDGYPNVTVLRMH